MKISNEERTKLIGWPYLIKRYLPVLFLFCPLIGTSLPTDVDQPIEIEADFAELDDQEGTTIYVGNVIVVQGSIRMTGDKLRVILTKDREIQDIHLEGQPATFKQTPKIGEEDIEGEARKIEYHSETDVVHLIQHAKVTQGERLTQGHRINYDIERSIVTVRSARANILNKDIVEKSKAQRVKIILPPPSEDESN